MKKLFTAAIILIVIALAGCTKDDSNPVSGPVSVTFRMSHIMSGDTAYFQFRTDTDVKLDTIIASLTSKQFMDVFSVNEPNRMFQKDVVYQWIGYYGVKQGQQWNFIFKGRLVSNNSKFETPYSYIVP